MKKSKAHCTDVFYRKQYNDYKKICDIHKCNVVEMESAALFANAKLYKKEAACILSVTDSFVTKDKISSYNRQNSLHSMILLAFETAFSQ